MDTAEPGPINQAPEDLSRMTGTFMRRWVFAVTAGETIGFMIPLPSEQSWHWPRHRALSSTL